LENVKGLLSNDDGKTFGTILEELGNIGYWVEWQTLNSKHFGVPQNRERVFIVGHSREHSTRQIFPITEVSRVPFQKNRSEQTSQKRIRSRPVCLAQTLEASYSKTKSLTNTVSSALSSRYGKDGSENLILQQHSHSGEDGKGRGIRVFENEVPTLTQQMGTGGNNVPMVVADRSRSYADLGRNLESPKPITNALSGVQKDNLVLMDGHPDGRPRNTLRSGRVPELGVANALDCDGYLRTGARPRDELGKPQLLPIGYRRIRRLTPTECERLQGFPDGWTEGVSDTQRYKLLGNAVTTNVIAFLGEKLKGCIE
jgi:DNA (cytosine-5)-methyltransferase 1